MTPKILWPSLKACRFETIFLGNTEHQWNITQIINSSTPICPGKIRGENAWAYGEFGDSRRHLLARAGDSLDDMKPLGCEKSMIEVVLG